MNLISCLQCEQDGQVTCGGIMDESLGPDSLPPWSLYGSFSDFPQVRKKYLYLYSNIKHKYCNIVWEEVRGGSSKLSCYLNCVLSWMLTSVRCAHCLSGQRNFT
jgi:hypothetical protein